MTTTIEYDGLRAVDTDEIAAILFAQRQTPYVWADAIDAPSESDEGTLVSICRDDAAAVLAALRSSPAVDGVGVSENVERMKRASEFLRQGVTPPAPISNTVRQSIADALDEAIAALGMAAEVKQLYDGEGDPYWQFVERDTATVSGQVFAANVEPLMDFDGNIIGFNVYEPAPSSPVSVEVGWQLIDTAPKDGTHVLVCFGEVSPIHPPTVAHWFEPTPSPGPMAGGWYLSVQQNEGPAVLPTHWQLVQPLPAAPAHREVGE